MGFENLFIDGLISYLMNKSADKKWSLAELANYVQGTVKGDSSFLIAGLAPLEIATAEQLSFFHNAKYSYMLEKTKAGALIVNEKDIKNIHCSCHFLIVSSSYLAFAKLTKIFAEKEEIIHFIHPTAIFAKNASIASSAYIAPYVVIEEKAQLSEKVYIGAHTVIGKNVTIGEGTKIYPNVTVYDNVKIGKNCIIHSGAVIGSDGFGFASSSEGWCKIYHSGSVVIKDNVEIGANTTIDRSVLAGKDTLIEDHVKLDNQVQIAHNVQVGKNTVVAGCSGIAGSAVIGKNCMIGGQVGITGHITVADGAIITGKTAVTKPLTEKAIYSSGLTVKKTNQWKNDLIRMRRIDQLWNLMKKVGG